METAQPAPAQLTFTHSKIVLPTPFQRAILQKTTRTVSDNSSVVSMLHSKRVLGSASDMSLSEGDRNTDIESDDTGGMLRELVARDHSTVSQIANGTQNTTALRSMAFGLHMRNDSGSLSFTSAFSLDLREELQTS